MTYKASPARRINVCAICGQHCQPHERNTDGTYTHDACLRPHSQRPSNTKTA